MTTNLKGRGNSKNFKNFHYEITIYDNINKEIKSKMYRTRDDIRRDFSITNGTIYNKMITKNKIKKYPNIISINRINKPAIEPTQAFFLTLDTII